MHLVCYFPYYSCLCTFWPYHPHLFLQLINFTAFILVIYRMTAYFAKSYLSYMSMTNLLQVYKPFQIEESSRDSVVVQKGQKQE